MMKKLILWTLVTTFCLIFATSCGEPKVLDTPNVTFNTESGVASWGEVDGATGYEYKINDGVSLFVSADVTKITLLKNETLTVRALGDGEKYLDSEWSEPTVSKVATPLATPKLEKTVIGNQVLISWEIDKNAVGYEYRINSGAITPLDGEIGSFLVNKGDYFYLHALADGETFTNSEWAMLKCE